MNEILLAASFSPSLGFFGWIIIGGLAGWIGSKIMGTDASMGVVLNIVVGIVVASSAVGCSPCSALMSPVVE